MIGIKRVCINPFINTVVSRTCHTWWFTLWVLHMSYNLWAIEWEWRFIQYTYIISCMFIYMEIKYITEQLLTIFESTWIWWTSVMLPLRWFGSTNHDQTHVSIPSPPTKLLNLEEMWRAEWWIEKAKYKRMRSQCNYQLLINFHWFHSKQLRITNNKTRRISHKRRSAKGKVQITILKAFNKNIINFVQDWLIPTASLSLSLSQILHERESAMKNAIRCCIACILPCGALDVVRIVHTNGRVEEISGGVTAAEIMKLYPKHVLKKPSSPEEGMCPKIVVVPPDAELKRGKIYFLMPAPEKTRSRSSSSSGKRRQQKESSGSSNDHRTAKTGCSINSVANFLMSDRYLSEILSEKISTQRDRRRQRVGVWRPHLESISETPMDAWSMIILVFWINLQ